MAAVRVLSHPPRHPYVDRLGEVVDLVHRHAAMPRLEDFHRPSWIRAHAEDWDLVHLHFGHEQYSVARIVEVVRTHQDLGTPVVPTTSSHVDEQVPTDLRVDVQGDRLSTTDLAAVFDAPSLPESARPESRDRAARAFLAGHEHLYRHAVGLTTMGHAIDLDTGGSHASGRRA